VGFYFILMISLLGISTDAWIASNKTEGEGVIGKNDRSINKL